MIKIGERAKRYLKEYIKIASADGVYFINVRIKCRNDGKLKTSMISLSKYLFSTLDSILIISESKSCNVVLGIKSIIGYNSNLVFAIEKSLRQGLGLEKIKVEELLEHSKKKIVAEFASAILKKKDIVFLFLNIKNRNIINEIYDMVVIPAKDINKKIDIDFFDQERVTKEFLPVLAGDYRYAILNLIRLDFRKKNLILSSKDVCYVDNNLKKYKSIEQYIIDLPKLLIIYNKEFIDQLYYNNLSQYLLEYAETIPSFFDNVVYLPRIVN